MNPKDRDKGIDYSQASTSADGCPSGGIGIRREEATYECGECGYSQIGYFGDCPGCRVPEGGEHKSDRPAWDRITYDINKRKYVCGKCGDGSTSIFGPCPRCAIRNEQIADKMQKERDRTNEMMLAAQNKIEPSAFTATETLREGAEIAAGVPASARVTTEGVRHDSGKPRMDLLPGDALMAVAEVMTWACTDKEPPYGDRNWEKGLPYSKLFSPCERHVWKWWQGVSELDDESKLHHLAHHACDALMLLASVMRGIGEDDRPCLPPQHGA